MIIFDFNKLRLFITYQTEHFEWWLSIVIEAQNTIKNTFLHL